MDVDVELIDCACYTAARRHPEVLGRIGRTVLPFQLTTSALMLGVGSFVALLWSWSMWWGQLVAGLPAAVMIAAVPLVLGRLAMVTSLGGRSPVLTALGVARYLFRCRAGLVSGRPVRRRARHRMAGRVVIGSRS